MGKDIKKTIARINELGKRFGLDTAADVELWCLLYDEDMQKFIFNRVRKQCREKNRVQPEREAFDYGFLDALSEFMGKTKTEHIREKDFFNYFVYIVGMRILDNYEADKKVHGPGGYAHNSVSLDAPVGDNDGEDGISLGELLPSGDSVEDELSTVASGEKLLYLCHLTVNLNRHRPGISEEQRRKAICYRLLFSNETVAVLRDGYERGSVFARHERDFMDSLDLNLTDFTYCIPPKNLPEISTGRLKTYRQMGLEGRKMDGEPHLPFIAKILLAVLSSAYDIQLTTARLSQLGKEWNAYMSAQAAEAMK